MALDEGKLKRAYYISRKLRNVMWQKDFTIQNIADNLWVSHAYISQNLNWRKIPTDEFFKKVMEAIWLTSIEIKKIFQEADKEEYKYKYWEEIDLIPQADLEIIQNTEKIKLEIMDELGEEFIKELSLSRKFRNNDTLIDEAREIWNFMKNEASRIKKEKK